MPLDDPWDDRWGLTLADAKVLTGDDSLDDTALHAAETDLVDVLGRRHTPPARTSEASLAFGRAIAWQATHRGGLDPEALGVPLGSESWPDYTANYGGGQGSSGGKVVHRLSPVARGILSRFGWLAESAVGYTTRGYAGAPTDDHLWETL